MNDQDRAALVRKWRDCIFGDGGERDKVFKLCADELEAHQPPPAPGEQPPQTPLAIHDKSCVQCGNFLANNEGTRCWTGADLLAKEWMASQRAPAPPPVQERESDFAAMAHRFMSKIRANYHTAKDVDEDAACAELLATAAKQAREGTQAEARPCSDHKMIQEIWDMLSELTKEKS